MVDLITYIDDQIKNCVTETRQFGLCHLIYGDNEQYPATVERRATKAVPDDRFLVTTYHRLLNGTYEPREDLQFGKRVIAQNLQKVRMVVFVKLGQSESLIDNIFNAMPDSFTSDDYQFANVTKTTAILRDRDQIWTAEFGTSKKDSYQMVYNLYAIEYDLQYIKCNVCV